MTARTPCQLGRGLLAGMERALYPAQDKASPLGFKAKAQQRQGRQTDLFDSA